MKDPINGIRKNGAHIIAKSLGRKKQQTTKKSTVSDKRIRNIPEVVLVRRGAVGFLGIWKGGRVGRRVGQMGSVYKQPETEVDDSCHS
jgi:hypothetical protein